MTHQTTIEADVLRALTVPNSKPMLWRLMTKWRLAIRYALRMPMPLHTEDRRVLEQVIFPWYDAQPDFRRILFVGCDWYTLHYARTFFAGCDYWTIDPAPRVRRFAGKHHIVAPLQELEQHFPAQRFDLIVCNGVFGYGLDDRADCERAFDACRSRLREGGHFLLGWDDIPGRQPQPLEALASLQAFERFDFPPLGGSRNLTDTAYRHTYDFYRR